MRASALIPTVSILMLAWASCPGLALPEEIVASQIVTNPSTSSIKALDSLLRASYDGTPEELRKRAGIPRSIDTATTLNRHDNGRDTVFTFHFKGASVVLYYAAVSARFFLQEATLVDLAPLAPLGITAGMTQDRLVGLFEDPYTVDAAASGDTHVRYETRDEATDTITFQFSSGRLRSVTFFPYLD